MGTLTLIAGGSSSPRPPAELIEARTRDAARALEKLVEALPEDDVLYPSLEMHAAALTARSVKSAR